MAHPGEQRFLILIDRDAGSELRRVPLETVAHCPRLGELLELSAAHESGGGTYEVIAVTHQLADVDGRLAQISGVLVTVRPVHEDESGVLAESVPDIIPLEVLSLERTPLKFGRITE